MKSENTNEFFKLAKELEIIQNKLIAFRGQRLKLTLKLHPHFLESGYNLLHYLALRQMNLKNLQLRLAHYGLSSLGRCESNVLRSAQQVLQRVRDSIKIRSRPEGNLPTFSWYDAEELMHRHTRDLLGPKPANRHIYIMVTAPGISDFSETWIKLILKAGANLIRINCAHGTKEDWEEMIKRIRQA